MNERGEGNERGDGPGGMTCWIDCHVPVELPDEIAR
jgi:hypothetical protein